MAALAALPVRGLIAAVFDSPWVLLPVQVLDGVGAGILGVALPGIIARVLAGGGHVGAGIAAAMTGQGIGASLSATVGGYTAQHFGYDSAFLALGAIALAALLIWLAEAGRCGLARAAGPVAAAASDPPPAVGIRPA